MTSVGGEGSLVVPEEGGQEGVSSAQKLVAGSNKKNAVGIARRGNKKGHRKRGYLKGY